MKLRVRGWSPSKYWIRLLLLLLLLLVPDVTSTA